jgi:hypothetical protein
MKEAIIVAVAFVAMLAVAILFVLNLISHTTFHALLALIVAGGSASIFIRKRGVCIVEQSPQADIDNRVHVAAVGK